MSLIKRILEKAKRSRNIVAIYSDQFSPASSSIGYVSMISKHIIELDAIAPNGVSDGIIIRKLVKVFKVEFGDRYAQKIGILSAQKLPVEPTRRASMRRKGVQSFYAALKHAKANNSVISIWLEAEADEAYRQGISAEME